MKKLLTKFLAAIAVCLLLGAGNANAAYEGQYFKMPGGHNNWNTYDGGVELNNDGLGIQVLNNFGSNEFKVMIYDTKDNTWYSTGGNIETEKWVSVTGNNSNNMKVNGATDGKSYKFFWDQSKKRLWVSPIYPSKIYLVGDVNGKSWEADNTFAINGNSSTGIYSGKVKLGNAPGLASFNISEASGTDASNWAGLGQRYGAKSANFIAKTDNTAMEFVENSYPNNFVVISGEYNITVNLKDKTIQLEQLSILKPEKLYLYGDLKGKSWKEDDYYEASNNNGIYNFSDVSIKGATGTAGFVAFFNSVDKTTDGEVDYVSMLPRFGGDFNEISGKAPAFENVVIPRNGQAITRNIIPYPTNGHDKTNDNEPVNFMVDNGMYDIKVDLNTGVITFTPITISYQWHNAEGLSISETHKATWGINHSIQLSANENLGHKAAQAATYKIEYTPISGSKQVKARVASSTGSGKDYVDISGTTLTFKKAGTYTVTATYDNSKDYNYQDIEDLPLIVEVAQANVTLSAGGKPSTPFSSSTTVQAETIANAFKIEGSTAEMKFGSDYEISINPNTTDYEGWVMASDDVAANDIYKSLPGYNADEDEATDLYGVYIETSQSSKIDGVYTSVKDLTAEYNNGVYDIKGSFPCSGVYTLTVTPVENGNFTFEEFSTEITITPNLYNIYSGIPGFNINGYAFSSAEGVPEINYLEKDGVAWQPLNKNKQPYSFAYTHGLFFASSLEINTDGLMDANSEAPAPLLGIKKKANETETEEEAYYGAEFSLTGKLGGTLEAKATKNGASATQQFRLDLTTDAETPTGVDSIEAADEGEAEYFNLQGVKVANPEHGIFIKVQNGKAVKVIL